MRLATAAMIAGCCLASGAAAADTSSCADRNALNGISVDARLVAIKYYFVGLVRGSTDQNRRACYEAQVLNDAGRIILNKTLELIERDCLTMEGAARIAVEAKCR